MTINEQTLKGKWLEIKGEVQKTWGDITNDELEKTKGDAKAIAGLIQQKYGEDKERVQQRFADIVDRYSDKKDRVVEDVKDSLRN